MNLPVEILEAVGEGRCVLFVGSRFTAEAVLANGGSYPSSKALAKQLGWVPPRRLPGARPKPVLPSVREGAAVFEAAQGRDALSASLRATLGAIGVPPLDAHRTALARFPLIVTSCWDDVLARAAAEDGREWAVHDRGAALPDPDPERPAIYRLWGGFDNSESMLITTADATRSPIDTPLRRQFRNLIRSHVVFFVGFRPDEEEFELLFGELSACYGGELPRCHLAVAQGKIDDYQWQRWVWRGLLLFTADPSEVMAELDRRLPS